MKPVKQSLIHDETKGIKGDCFRACICTLLEIGIDEAPHFTTYPEDQWWDVAVAFCKTRGYNIAWEQDCPKSDIEYYIVCGTSPRGLRHAVIYSRGRLVHDPHPDGGDVVNPYAYIWLETREAKTMEVAC